MRTEMNVFREKINLNFVVPDQKGSLRSFISDPFCKILSISRRAQVSNFRKVFRRADPYLTIMLQVSLNAGDFDAAWRKGDCGNSRSKSPSNSLIHVSPGTVTALPFLPWQSRLLRLFSIENINEHSVWISMGITLQFGHYRGRVRSTLYRNALDITISMWNMT